MDNRTNQTEFTSVTVVVGANDEKSTLISTVDKVLTECGNIEKILLVRPKNVSAECIDAIRLLEKRYPGQAVDFIQTRPYIGGAIRDGFDSAKTSHIMLLPGDLAIGLDVIPLLLEKAKKEPGKIYKISRWLNKDSFHGYGIIRKLLNRCAQIFLRILFKAQITDLTCPVQIMPTVLYQSINWKELNFPFLEEMVLVPLRLGTSIEEIPAECFGRSEGSSNNSFRQTALYLKTAMRIRFSAKEKLLKR